MFSLERSELQILLATTFLGLIIGAVYTQVLYLSGPGAEGTIWLGMAIGGTIGFFISYFEMVFVGRPGALFRRLGFWISLFSRAAAYLSIILISTLSWQYFYQVLTGIPVIILNAEWNETLVDLGFSFVVALVIIFYMQMRQFIGSRTLRNLIFGRYHTPQVEERVFVVFDLVGSTTYAQEAGDIKFHRLLNSFFELLDNPIHQHGGEVHSYVGDAVYAVWPVLPEKQKNNRVLMALRDAAKALQKEEKRLQAEYGIVPRFRAAVHSGTVVVGETGYRKRQITYLGNTVNIVSRIEALTKTNNGNYLATANFIEGLELPAGVEATILGEFEVKGSTAPVTLYRISV